MDKSHAVQIVIDRGLYLQKKVLLPESVKLLFESKHPFDYIIWSRSPYTQVYSETGLSLKPHLDDMAQLIGIDTKCLDKSNQRLRFKGRNALLLRGERAICGNQILSDAQAVQMVLEKSARSAIEAAIVEKGHVISLPERYLMRLIYKMKYSRMNDTNRK